MRSGKVVAAAEKNRKLRIAPGKYGLGGGSCGKGNLQKFAEATKKVLPRRPRAAARLSRAKRAKPMFAGVFVRFLKRTGTLWHGLKRAGAPRCHMGDMTRD